MFSLDDRIDGRPVVAVLSQASGISVVIRIPAQLGVLRWIYEWFVAYCSQKVDQGIDEPEFSFLYMVPGDVTGLPSGTVDGVAVLEAGFGGEALGPRDGLMVPLYDLLSALGRTLDCERPG